MTLSDDEAGIIRGRLHELGSKLMLALLALHVAGALRHGRSSLRRMAGPRPQQSAR